MSVLSNKRVAIIGTKTKQICEIESVLKKHGVRIDFVDYETFDIDELVSKVPELILLNHSDNEQSCIEIFTTLRKYKIDQTIPIFILTKNINLEANEILAYGATDYITPQENAHSVLQKINNVFGINDSFSANSVIDITPEEADISTTGIKVFVIEDDPLLRNLLSTRLSRSGFPFEFSSNANGAVIAMRQFLPQVIIMDLMLPGKSGFELLAEIQMDNILKNVPVIVFSNKDSQEDRDKAQEFGVSTFLVKAMTDLSELIEIIESLAKKNS